MRPSIERHDTDILILGSGGAGLFAALHAQQAVDGGSDEPFYRAKLCSAEFAIHQWLPVGRAQHAVIEAGWHCFGQFDSAAY